MARQVRIFVSSPSDTQFERMRVDRVIERLNGEFAGTVVLSTVRWEREFYTAASTFQQQIPQASDCDIVIAILRHRIGTELPLDFARMPNGDAYPSGTAYEILTAIDAGRQRGLPDVYVFRYPESPSIKLDDQATSAVISAQWERLKTFFESWFQTPDGHFTAAFQQFHSTDEFETQVETLLRKWLTERVLNTRAVAWNITTQGSPFRGLSAFDSRHAAVFFGRSRETAAAIDVLKDAAASGTPFLLVIGPSGAGKSSLTHAGIVPRLTSPGVVPTVDVWRAATMRPGMEIGQPIASLSQSLFAAVPELADSDGATPAALRDLLSHADDTSVRPIVGALERVAAAERRAHGYDRPVVAHLLIVIDQLDELFGNDVAEAERKRFSRLLRLLTKTSRVWVIATLRADLYERLLADDDLRDLKSAGASFDLAPPGAAELADIVRLPARAADLVYETDTATHERLDDRLLRDADRPDMLPLVQFTLDQLFAQRQVVGGETRLTFAAYQHLGGLPGAIDKEAERAVQSVGEAEREALPRLLRQLAAPAEGHERGKDSGQLTTRSVPMAHAVNDDASARLVQALVNARILLSSGESGTATIRLAHQRVLDSWQRAKDIVAANADFYRIRNEVEDEHRRWIASGRKQDLLIAAGLPLVEAETIRERYAGELSPSVLDFIEASSRRGRARQRRQQIAVAAFATLAIVAGAAGLWALRQQNTAEQLLSDSRAATSRFLADLARQRVNERQYAEAVALAANAVRLDVPDWPRVPTADNALALAMQSYNDASVRPLVGFVGHDGAVRGAEFSPDTARLLTWSYDATARIWDVASGAQLQVLTHDDGVRGGHFSTDGQRVLTWSFDGTVRIWDAKTGKATQTLKHDDVVRGAVWSGDQARVLSWSDDGTARLWDATDGHRLGTMQHTGAVLAARFFDGDRRILTRAFGKPHTIGIWNGADGSPIVSIEHDQALGATLFANESRVLTWADDKTARIFDAMTGAELRRFTHAKAVTGAALSADEKVLATWSENTVSVWDPSSGAERASLMHAAPVLGAALSANGARLIAWTGNNMATLWDVAARRTLVTLLHADQVFGARISADGQAAVSWSYDGTARFVTFSDKGEPRNVVLRHEGPVRDALFAGNSVVWTRSDDGTARVWSAGGLETARLGHRGEVLGFALPTKGTQIVTVSMDGNARLWDYAPAGRFVELKHDGNVAGASFSADGRRLATVSADRTARVWDTITNKELYRVQHEAAVAGVLFTSADGPLVTWSTDGTIRLSDPSSGALRRTFKGDQPVRGAALMNGRLLAWFDGGGARLWNTSSGAQVAEIAGCSIDGNFSDDARHALVVCPDGSVHVLDAESGKETTRLADARAASAVLSAHGDRILSWGRDNFARLWDVASGTVIRELPHSKPASGGVFTPNGERVWTWSEDGSAREWDSSNGRELRRLQHGDAVAKAFLVDDGTKLITNSSSGTPGWNTRLWDVGTGEPLASLTALAQVTVSKDGRRLAAWLSATAGGPTLQLWRPLWEPTATLEDQALTLASRLKPLSPLARCHVHLDNDGCDRFPADSESMLALIGDDKHLRLESSVNARPINLRDDVKVEVAVNTRYETFIFHNRPFQQPVRRIEYNKATLRMIFRLAGGEARDFGISVDRRIGKYIGEANRVLVVLMDEKTGKPIEGDFFPILSY